MKRRRRRKKNPSPLAVTGIAVGASAAVGLATYFGLRRLYVSQVLNTCAKELGLSVSELEGAAPQMSQEASRYM